MPHQTYSKIHFPVPPILMTVKEDTERYRLKKSSRKYRETTLLKRIPIHKLMDLKIDYAFKQLFGKEKNKQITVVFLNAILQKTGREPIKDIAFKNIEASGEYDGDKASRLDLLVVTETGEQINVEIQFTNQYNMIKRSIYYWSGIYRSQLLQGMGYEEIRPVISINIMNFDYFDQTKRFHTMYHLYEDEKMFKLTDVMEFHFLEMPKLIQMWKEEKLDPWNDILARWLLLLGIVDRKTEKIYDDIFQELEEIAMDDKTLESAFQNWEELSMNSEEYLAYEARYKKILDEEAAKREAELRLQRAEKKAREKGMKEGVTREKEQTARRLLKSGSTVEAVVNFTELTEARVTEIARELLA